MIVILGGTGMLGSMLVDYLSKDNQIVATARTEQKPKDNVRWKRFDVLQDRDNIEQIIDGCDWVINAIGWIPQRHNGKVNTRDIYRINMRFPLYLNKAALVTNSKVIHISTDCVYDGLTGCYKESSVHTSADDYGKSKSKGEILDSRFYNLRCSIIGLEPQGYSLLGWFLKQSPKVNIDGYQNVFWNGITTLAFAKICAGIIKCNTRLPHIQHIVPANILNKYELLVNTAKYFNRQDIIINKTNHKFSDRTLSTDNSKLNLKLWRLAGYKGIPSIQELIKELAEYKDGVK